MENKLLDFDAPVSEDSSPLPYVVLIEDPEDGKFYVRAMSKSCWDILGLDRSKANQLKKEDWFRFIHPDDFEKSAKLVRAIREAGFSNKNEQCFFSARVIKQAKRSYEWMSGYLKTGDPIEGHRTLYCVFFTRADIEFLDRQMWNDNLPGTTLVRSVLDSLEAPVFWKDNRGRFIGANKAFLNYFGVSREQIVGKLAVQTNTELADFQALSRMENSILSGKESEIHETVRFLQKGKQREAQLSYSPLTRGDKIIGLVGSFIDVTEANESKRVLEKLASFDYLTGMKNRRMFFQSLAAAAKEYQEGGKDFAVLMMDLDSFKEINDTFGHDIGDQILVEFSRKAADIIKDRGELYRLGGDEFIALIPFDEKEEILATKDAIQSQLTIVFDADGHELKVVCSLGFAIFGDYLDTDILMREADKWMYRDKFLKKAKR